MSRLALSLRGISARRGIHTSRSLLSQLSAAEIAQSKTDENAQVIDKTVKRFGRSRIFRDEKGPTYEHRFLKGPETVAVVGCPFSGGQGKSGVDLGPNALVERGLLTQLSELGWKVHYEGPAEFGDIPYINPNQPDAATARQVLPDPEMGGMKKPRLVSAVNQRAMEIIREHALEGRLPLTLGGDHSLAMATVSGIKAAYPDACLVWVDAHADINTPLSSDSGNIHGMPISFLLGLPGTDMAPFSDWIKPCLKPSDIVYIGLRDLDVEEKKILRELGIKCFTMHEVDRLGVGEVVKRALAHVNPKGERPVHLSFDVDACDPSVAGSTGTPVQGGLTFREAHYICESIAETGCLVGLDIMEVNPALGDEKSVTDTVAVGCSLARAALGETLL